MPLIINKEIASEKVRLAVGIEDEDFDKFIDEAQEFDFKKVVPELFYFEVIDKLKLPLSNATPAIWLLLLNGGGYDYSGNRYYFKGLAAVVSFFAYARYVLNGPLQSTSFGLTIKKTPHSEPVELAERRTNYYKKQQEANDLLIDCVKFIYRNAESFPTFTAGNCFPDIRSQCCSNDNENKFGNGFETTVIQ